MYKDGKFSLDPFSTYSSVNTHSNSLNVTIPNAYTIRLDLFNKDAITSKLPTLNRKNQRQNFIDKFNFMLTAVSPAR